MNRIAVVLITAALAGLLWVVLDSSADRAAAERNGSGPERPAELSVRTDPAEEPTDLPAGSDAAVSLSGRVLTAAGERAAGAQVRVVPLDAESWPLAKRPFFRAACDEIGEFAVRGIPAGLYRVEARTKDARGYHPILPVRKGRCSVVTVRLAPVASISGEVVTESGVPVAGATVSADLGAVIRRIQGALGVRGLPLEGRLQAVTNDSGRFLIGDLPVGQYEIEVRADGYVPRRVPFVNAPNPGIRVELVDTFTVRGEVTWDPKSHPKSVRVFDEQTGAETTVIPTRSPAFELRGLPRGPHTIRAIAVGGAMAVEQIEIAPGAGNNGILLALGRSVKVAGRVSDEDGRRAGGRFEVLALEERATGARLIPITMFEVEKDGTYEVLLSPGSWVFRPVEHGLQTAEYARAFLQNGLTRHGYGEYEVIRIRGPSAWRSLKLVHVGYISGRVTRPGGWPVADLKIAVDGDDATVTDGAGRFRLTNLPLRRDLRISAGSKARVFRLSSKNNVAKCDFVLPSSGTGAVRGQVVSEESHPVPGATVLFRDGYAVTDIDGRFERKNVASVLHDLRFFAPGYAMGIRSRVEVSPVGVTELPLLVLPWNAFRVGGRVLDGDGFPLPGVRVRVLFPNVFTPFDTVTDEGGWFRQEGPGGIPGRAFVTASAAGYTSEDTSVLAGAGAESLKFGLNISHTIRILFDAPSKSVTYLRFRIRSTAKASVKVARMEFEFAVKPGAKYADLTHLPPGKYRIYVYVGKHHRTRVDVDSRDTKGLVVAGPISLSR